MKQQLLNTKEDCQWLKDTALKGRAVDFNFASFVLYGNEDCPEKVDFYTAENPLITDTPFPVIFNN